MHKTAGFVDKNRSNIVIEGACDEIVDATGEEKSQLTSPDLALEYLNKTNADLIVANLGTEHRASSANLKYHDKLAREISIKTGPKLVLHGTSSVSNDQIKNFFKDGIAKVNIWNALERDSSPILLEEMIRNAAKIAGVKKTSELFSEGLLGKYADRTGSPSLSHYTTVYRQDIIFTKMKEIVLDYLKLWYV
jgi:hypothetical protein